MILWSQDCLLFHVILTFISSAANCPPLSPSSNMSLSTTATTVGISVTISCATGFKLAGSVNTILCTTNGQWDPKELPQCVNGKQSTRDLIVVCCL